MIDFGLSGKRAVVSGAGYIPERAGHGWFTSLALAQAGASVACIDIDKQRANRILGELTAPLRDKRTEEQRNINHGSDSECEAGSAGLEESDPSC